MVGLLNVGALYDVQRNLAPAVERYEQALSVARTLADRPREALIRLALSSAHRVLGNPEAARQVVEGAETQLRPEVGASAEPVAVLADLLADAEGPWWGPEERLELRRRLTELLRRVPGVERPAVRHALAQPLPYEVTGSASLPLDVVNLVNVALSSSPPVVFQLLEQTRPFVRGTPLERELIALREQVAKTLQQAE